MSKQVLVAYATKYGATGEIAAKIGEVLTQAGLTVDVAPADQVGDLARYEAVVLGSAVYIGRWRREAVKFLKRNEALLSQRPVWLFSSGPTGGGDPDELADGWRFPKSLQPIADNIKPREIAVFHGAVDVGKLKPIAKWMISKVGAALEDSRDWDAISSWASNIASTLALR